VPFGVAYGGVAVYTGAEFSVDSWGPVAFALPKGVVAAPGPGFRSAGLLEYKRPYLSIYGRIVRIWALLGFYVELRTSPALCLHRGKWPYRTRAAAVLAWGSFLLIRVCAFVLRCFCRPVGRIPPSGRRFTPDHPLGPTRVSTIGAIRSEDTVGRGV
jgi:hypothetical protein